MDPHYLISFKQSSLLGREWEHFLRTMTIDQIAGDQTHSTKCLGDRQLKNPMTSQTEAGVPVLDARVGCEIEKIIKDGPGWELWLSGGPVPS